MISVMSGCETLLRFITLTALDAEIDVDMDKCKELLLERGNIFLETDKLAREK